MTEPKHSPAPWRVDYKWSFANLGIYSGEGFHVATVCRPETTIYLPEGRGWATEEEDRDRLYHANASLVAAAPEMRRVLRDLIHASDARDATEFLAAIEVARHVLLRAKDAHYSADKEAGEVG